MGVWKVSSFMSYLPSSNWNTLWLCSLSVRTLNQLHSCMHVCCIAPLAYQCDPRRSGRSVFHIQLLLLTCLSQCRSRVCCLSCSPLNDSPRARRHQDLAFIMAFLRSSAVPLVASYVVLMTMSLVAVILRFISQHILQRSIKGHDILCVVSLVSR